VRNLLTDVAGVAVGHATDFALGSGVTAILFDPPAIAAVSVLGGAPGGRDIGLLAPEMTVEAVDAIVLSGAAPRSGLTRPAASRRRYARWAEAMPFATPASRSFRKRSSSIC
jgi:L-aminopeptidase/D-esterase-like protein